MGEVNFMALAKEWQAAIAGLGVGAIYAFRIWLSARKELRTDKEGESSTGAYDQTINMLRKENSRLYELVEKQSLELSRLSALVNKEGKPNKTVVHKEVDHD